MRNILTGISLLLGVLLTVLPASAQENGTGSDSRQEDIAATAPEESTVNVKEVVFGHIGDAYEWHITT